MRGGALKKCECSFVFTNIRSFFPKKDDLCSVINDSNADIIVLTETWLNSKITTPELFQCNKQYVVYRSDRTGRIGGGVLLAVNESIDCFSVPINTNLELIWCCLTLSFKKILLGVCYRSPSSDSSFCDDLYDCLNQITTRFHGAEIMLLGDFNFPTIVWSHINPFSYPASAEADRFISICSDFGITQIVSRPTRVTPHTSSLLDLILTSSADNVSTVTHIPGLSDHDILHFTLTITQPKMHRQKQKFRDYKKANYTAINSELSSFLDTFLPLHLERCVETNWSIFKNKIADLVTKYVPLRTVYTKNKAPWYNTYLNRLSNKKKRLFRTAKHSLKQTHWLAYKKAANSYLSALRSAKSSFFNCTLPTLLKANPKRFWYTIRGSTNKPTISLLTCSGDSVPTHLCATILNDTFTQSFSSPKIPDQMPAISPTNYHFMDPIAFDATGIKSVIKKSKPKVSCGVDEINIIFLQNTVEYCSIILQCIYSQSYNSGTIPRDWKTGKVIPIHKTGSTHDPHNYRPISLTSVPCKIMEHVIYTHLVTFLENNNFFTVTQHGFRKHFSCDTQLISFTNDLHVNLDSGFLTDCIFLDFSKAFDKVNHALLLYKLSVINIDPAVINWIRAFLTSRVQFVTVNDANSPSAPVDSGVPQGSVLGPLLFLIYINDLPTHVSSKMCLFADDCVLYRKIIHHSDIMTTQKDLNSINEWCRTWRMELNINKCKSMRISRTNVMSPTYLLNNTPLECVTSYRYLGVHITNNLSWKTHIDHITAKANRTLGYIRRNFSLAPSSLKLLLYTTYIRPQLEYASSVWDPGHVTLIHSLEAIQNRSARFILNNYQRTASITNMKAFLHLPLLSTRRKISRLCLFHKTFYHNTYLRSLWVQPPSYISSRLNHRQKVHLPHCNTVSYSHSFIPQTSKEWNYLPASLTCITDTDNFKLAVQGLIL